MPFITKKHLLLCLLSFFGIISFGESFAENSNLDTVQTKVGGDYKIQSIDKTDSGFRIHFTAKTKTGSADTIILNSDHIHFGLDVGSEIKISAEVDSVSQPKVEAKQVLFFLPAPEGFLPVWLLSSKAKGFEKGSTNYLKMHAPQSDYMVF